MLDNQIIAEISHWTYCLSMEKNDFRARTIAAMKEKKIKKSELSRASGVPYHALDKWLKGTTASTNIEFAIAIANALGIAIETDEGFDELKPLYYGLSEQDREVVVKMVRGLAGVPASQE